MTEDILFDNIYVGHSINDAKSLAAETFEIKKNLEKAAAKAAEPEDEEEESASFKEDPISYIRSKVLTFVESAKEDPVAAFKTQPETGAALAAALFTFLGMIGALFGLIGSAQKPVVTKVCRVFYHVMLGIFSPFCGSHRRRLLHPQHLLHPLATRRRRTRRKMVRRNALASKHLDVVYFCLVGASCPTTRSLCTSPGRSNKLLWYRI